MPPDQFFFFCRFEETNAVIFYRLCFHLFFVQPQAFLGFSLFKRTQLRQDFDVFYKKKTVTPCQNRESIARLNNAFHFDL
jgi:hypothetical protein